jgi:hypothetical protein
MSGPHSPPVKMYCSFKCEKWTTAVKHAVLTKNDDVSLSDKVEVYEIPNISTCSPDRIVYIDFQRDGQSIGQCLAFLEIGNEPGDKDTIIERWYLISPPKSKQPTRSPFQSDQHIRVPKDIRSKIQSNSPQMTRNEAPSGKGKGDKGSPDERVKSEVLIRIRITKECRVLLKPNSIDHYYKFGIELGQGGFSVVKQATHLPNGKQVAIKIMEVKPNIDKDKQSFVEEPIVQIEQEIDIMRMMKHPNIVEFYDCFRTPDKVYLVMELLIGGELLDVVSERGSLEPIEAGNIIKQVAEGVAYMHKNGIVHRDLYESLRIY